MFNFLRSPNRDVLAEPKRLSTADYLCRLMEEQNQLLREVCLALGRHAQSPKANPAVNVRRQYTAEDVTRVTRDMTEDRLRKEQERIAAPWRTGPENPPMPGSNGTTPAGNGQDVAQ